MTSNKLFTNLLYLVITISFFSCSQLRYTNYGKPLDFLKANRISMSKTLYAYIYIGIYIYILYYIILKN